MVTHPMPWNPIIANWLGGIEPAWTLLDQTSLANLRYPPSPGSGPIQLATDLTREEIEQSAVGRNALILLRFAAKGSGLKMTAMGNLSRAVVAELREHLEWPGFDQAFHFRLDKVINEADFFPLFFLRNLVQAAGLLRRYKGHLRATPRGRKMLLEANVRTLLAGLFDVAFWYLDLTYFSWNPYEGWPQRDVGTILWSLSVAAHDWQSSEQLTRLCTIPTIDLFDGPYDATSSALHGQILRPLAWFGLLEQKDAVIEAGRVVTPNLYRKTPLFDRFLSFDVKLASPPASRH